MLPAVFRIDEDRSGTASYEEIDMLLSFAALDMTADERKQARDVADVVRDGEITRMEFVQMCSTQLWNVPIPQIDLAVQNVQYARDALSNRNKRKWKKVADDIDRWAAVVIPSLYFATQILLFNTDFQDTYLDDSTSKADGSAVFVEKFRDRGIVVLAIYAFALLLCAGAYVLHRRQKAKLAKEKKRAEVESIKQRETRLAGEMKKHMTKERASRATFSGPADPATPANLAQSGSVSFDSELKA